MALKDRLAALLVQIRNDLEKAGASVLLDGGDMSQGTPIVNLGKAAMELSGIKACRFR